MKKYEILAEENKYSILTPGTTIDFQDDHDKPIHPS